VWLANTRGNKYSKGHDHEDKSPHSASKSERLRFWDFSIDHLAKFDVPAVVDYILSVTGRENLAYIGYSQGTSQIFAALSLSEELNHKIKVVLAMAPALRPKPINNKYINGMIRMMKPRILFSVFGGGSFLPFTHTVREIVDPTFFAGIIEGSLYLLLSWECDKFGPKKKREPLYYHLFSDAAVSNLVVCRVILKADYETDL
jgi:lysosomal acid lipase/cholesteryl ester hydrolase